MTDKSRGGAFNGIPANSTMVKETLGTAMRRFTEFRYSVRMRLD